ncbi:MAG: hypothetical protein LBT50_06495 [Prevotellaceae bacterium]|jgi:hypothetical protein|nr:hypothetical protein [Prevotellaceae bacterium]
MVKKRLTSEVIEKVTHRKRLSVRRELQLVLGYTEAGLWFALNKNLWNGILTTETVLSFLEEHLNMSRDIMIETEGTEV